MLKQKTVAKWLAIVLLLTVAVGSYLLYDAVFKKADGTANAVKDENNENESIADIEVQEPEHVPFYTTLPRSSETINGVEVAHVGGEEDDEFLASVSVGENNFTFFYANSVEYDVRENGLHLAYFKNNELLFTDKICEGKFLDAKLCASGVALVYKTESKTVLMIFSADGNIVATMPISDADFFKFYLHGSVLTSFKIIDGYLRFSEYIDEVKEQLSPYVIKAKGTTIEVVVYASGKFLVLTSSSDGVYGYTYEPNLGFKSAFIYDKLSFKQIVSVGNSTDSVLALLLNSEKNGLVLSTLSSDFSISSRKAVEDVSDGVITKNGDGFDIVGNGKTLTFCKHLDLISSTENELDFDAVLTIAPHKATTFFVAKTNDGYSLFSSDGELSTLPSFVSSPLILPCQNGVKVFLSSSSSAGITRACFGGSDVFSFVFPQPIFN